MWVIFESNERLVDVLKFELARLLFAALLSEEQVAFAVFVEIVPNQLEEFMNALLRERTMLQEV